MAKLGNDQHLISYLRSLYNESEAAMQQKSRLWDQKRKFAFGEQWTKQRPSYKSSVVLNYIYSVMERKTAILTDAKPTFDVVPRKKGEKIKEVASVLKRIVAALWDEMHMDIRIAQMYGFAEIFGYVPVRTIWNKALDLGRGDMDVSAIDPRAFKFDPFVVCPAELHKAEYIITEDVVPLRLIREQFPQRGKFVKSDPNYSTFTTGKPHGGLLSPMWRIFKSARTKTTEGLPRAVRTDFWLRDGTRGEDGHPLWPRGRLITVAGDVILQDVENPFFDGKFPFTMMDWHSDTDSAIGFSEVDLLEEAQKAFNKLIGQIIDNATLMNNLVYIGDTDALSPEDWNKLDNSPGEILKKHPGRELRREAPPPLPAYLFTILQLLIGGIETISGMTEVVSGKKPGQLRSGIAIESLQLAAQSVLRLKARKLEAMLVDIGQMMISRIYQYMTDDRVFFLIGDDAEEFVFERKQLLYDDMKTDLAFRDFRFIVQPGSSLNLTKVQKMMMASFLYQLGIIDDEAVLDQIDFPNKEEVARRTKLKQIAKLQAGPTGRVAKPKMKAGAGGGLGQVGAA